MGVVTYAIYENGVLRPETPLMLSLGSRVRVTIEPVEFCGADDQDWAELEQLWKETHIDGGVHLTRDQLHDRH